MRFDKDLKIWEFEVGDKVTIKSATQLMDDRFDYSRPCPVDSMYEYAGMKAIIIAKRTSSSGYPSYKIEGNFWNWTEEMFVLPNAPRPKISKATIEAINILQAMVDDGILSRNFQEVIKLLKTDNPDKRKISERLSYLSNLETVAFNRAMSVSHNRHLCVGAHYPSDLRITTIYNYFLN